MSETSGEVPQTVQGKTENIFAKAFKRMQSSLFRRPPTKPLEIPTSQEPVTLQESYPSPDRLRVSQKLLFHTTTLDQLDSIASKGLFAVELDKDVGQQIMGENLAYSLYFPIEREADRKGMEPSQIPDATLDNYVLTIWQRNSSVVRVANRARDSIGHNQITAKTSDPIPDSYFTASTESNADSLKWLISLDPNLARNLSQNNLLAAVQIDRSTREGLLKLMILASQGKVSAISIEEQIKTQLAGGKTKYLKAGTNIDDISFELASTIERELARSVIVPYMNLSRKELATDGGVEKPNSATLEAFKFALAFRLNVNDAVTARYLDGCIRELKQIMKSHGLDTNKLKKEALTEIKEEESSQTGIKTTTNFNSYINNNFFAGTNAALAAIKLKESSNH